MPPSHSDDAEQIAAARARLDVQVLAAMVLQGEIGSGKGEVFVGPFALALMMRQYDHLNTGNPSFKFGIPVKEITLHFDSVASMTAIRSLKLHGKKIKTADFDGKTMQGSWKVVQNQGATMKLEALLEGHPPVVFFLNATPSSDPLLPLLSPGHRTSSFRVSLPLRHAHQRQPLTSFPIPSPGAQLVVLLAAIKDGWNGRSGRNAGVWERVREVHLWVGMQTTQHALVEEFGDAEVEGVMGCLRPPLHRTPGAPSLRATLLHFTTSILSTPAAAEEYLGWWEREMRDYDSDSDGEGAGRGKGVESRERGEMRKSWAEAVRKVERLLARPTPVPLTPVSDSDEEHRKKKHDPISRGKFARELARR